MKQLKNLELWKCKITPKLDPSVSWFPSDQIIIGPRFLCECLVLQKITSNWIFCMMISFPIKLTLEPFIIVFIFVWYIQLGIQINRNLVMWKICHIELNYSKPICENLSAEENSNVQSIVQIRTNNFEMVSKKKSISRNFHQTLKK